jgi:repressor LexA
MPNTQIPKISKRDPHKLSERQKKILVFIEKFLKRFGYPPTIREIGEAVDIGSTSVVNYNLNKLVNAGYLERSPEVSRGLRLLKNLDNQAVNYEHGLEVRVAEAINITRVPLIGKIVAGEPVMQPGDDFGYYFDNDELIEVPARLLGKRAQTENIYALRVNGDSMIDALVGHNDIVVLQRQDTAENGEMVAVWLDENNETTLKYFYREGPKVRLQPANTTMAPIYVDARRVKIQGRVLAVLRGL